MNLPTYSKAAILTELHKPLLIDEVELPKTLAVGQVLVKVFYSGICGYQLGEINGVKGSDPYLPHLLGHEGSAEVLAIGAGVQNIAVGDYVVMHWRKGRGIDAPMPQYQWHGSSLNAGSVTTFNEYAVVSENRLTPIPNDFNLRLAPLLGCAVTTGFGVITNNARVKIGESVVIYGAGGVGLNMVQAAAMVSAYPIIAIDQYPEKLLLAQKLGATHIINAAQVDPVEEVESILGKSKLDIAIDNTGNPQVIESCYQLTAKQGKVILVGVPRQGGNISIYSLPLHFGKIISGSHGGESEPAEDIPRFIRLFKANKLELEPIITNEFQFFEINKAIAGMKDGTIAGRCLIKF